jgi:hypothetical protein
MAKKNKRITAKFKNWTDKMLNDANFFLEYTFGKIARRAVDKLRSNGSIDSNALVESVKAKVHFKRSRAKKRRGGSIWAGVGIDKDLDKFKDKEYRKPVHYAHLIEKGFTHYPDGKKIEAKPFLQPAVNSVTGGSKEIERKLYQIIENASKDIPNDFEDFKVEFEK